MDYRESRGYIDAASAYGSVLGLSNMQEMLKRLNHPENDLKFVHVGGTNGKGSTVAYLYTTLMESGFNVGRYTSPTLYSYRERMEVSGQRVSREAFARYVTRIREVIETMTADGLPHPTPFEIETTAAFLFFQEEGCDLVILEVGMGGDLDATNVIKNTVLAVLTSISMDHEAYLGNTLSAIALKKAGIIKAGSSVVSTLQKKEVEEVLRKKAAEEKVQIVFADYKRAKPVKESLSGQSFLYQGEEYELRLSGVCQVENAVLALEALRLLDEKGFSTTLEQRKRGLIKTQWNGRFTVIHEKPTVIVDGAHNPGAADVLVSSIQTYLEGKKLYYIMGMFQDKDYRYVAAKTCPYAEKIWTIETPGNPRALPAKALADVIKELGKEAVPMESIREAAAAALDEASEDAVILSFGSLSNIGELTEILEERHDRFTGMQKKN